MTQTTRRGFFRNILLAGAALSASATGPAAPTVEAATSGAIKGICLYVPSLGKAAEFVELMNRSAPGEWQMHPLQGSVDERYFTAKDIYLQARTRVNTLVGIVDPATFQLIHEAVTSNGGRFHYVRYEDRNRVSFSVQV